MASGHGHSGVLAVVRRAATLPGLRRMTRVGPLLRLSFALRGGLVRERLRFAARELVGRGHEPAVYTRPGGIALAIRHRTPDVLVLDELFSQGEYDPPAAMAPALDELPAAAHIVDLGANIGLFGVWALERFPGATITALEPDAGNAAVHRRVIAANGREDTWVLHEAAAASREGTMRFEPGSFTTSHASTRGRLAVPAVDALPLLAEADLAKIDIEGGEWELLADPRLRDSSGRRVLVVEYHPQGCPDDDPRSGCAELLTRAGFEVAEGGRTPRYRTGTIWGWRRT